MRSFLTPAAAAAIALLCAASLPARVVQVDIDSIVHPVTVRVVTSAITQAQREHADAVLIRLSTPGGFMDATRDIIEQIFHSPVPIIMWVGPSGARAASAGFFLLEAGDIAAMAPGTNTGASHPVLADGAKMDSVMNAKVENDAAALMRTITTHRNRNPQAAEKAVRESVSYTDREALDLHLIDLIAPDPESLIHQLQGRSITRFDGSVQTLHFADTAIDLYQPTLRERILLAIADPNIALLLVVVGLLGIYLEFTSPGLFAPGVIGGVLVLLGLTALSVFPIDWLGAALMILGLIFFILEAKYPTHGILTVGGAVGLALGAVMLINTNVPELRVRWSTAIGLALPFALITSFLFSIAIRARHNKVVTGMEGMIGQMGVAVGELNPAGTVLVRGEYWNAQASGRVPASEPVRITGIDGLTLRVEPTPRPGGTYAQGDLMNGVPLLLVIFIFGIYILSSIKILAEYERGVIFRLGRLLPQAKGPGVILVFAPLDRMVRISLRVDTIEVPPQDVITRDNVTVKVNAVIYFRVLEPRLAVTEVSNFLYATSQLAQTTLRSVLGEVELDGLLSKRDELNVRLQSILDEHTSPWGVKVTLVSVKQVDLPEQMIRAIGRQAEAEREKRAKIIHAEGEYTASEKLAMAAEVIQRQPAAIQLRYLQTLVEIGTEKNTTIVFPLPIDILTSLDHALNAGKREETGKS